MSWLKSPLNPTKLDLSGVRLKATYELSGDRNDAERTAEQLVVEQTIEFPRDLVPDDDIQREVIGQILSLEQVADDLYRLEVSHAIELAGDLVTQLLNVLYGNISMVPGVKLVDVELPHELLGALTGPQLGLGGLRKLLDRPSGPLLATALKPMGTSIEDLARFAYELVVNGIELIKEDHSFATQVFHPYEERVPILAEAVRRGSAERGRPAVFLPALNVPFDAMGPSIDLALESGAGGALVLPGLTGYDAMRWVAENTPDGFVIQSHPAFLGAFVSTSHHGIAHDLMFGLLPRLAGADVSIFPNFGGRFSFSRDICLSIADRCRTASGPIGPAWPAPAGGMTVDKVRMMLDFYGPDTVLLIGGGLYRGSIAEQVTAMAAAVLEGE